MGVKTCSKCSLSKPATSEFFCSSKTNRDGLYSSCKKCQAATSARWKNNNPDKLPSKTTLRERSRSRRETHPGEEQRHRLTRYRRYRDELLDYYSNGDPKCACCAEWRREFLAFDHINGCGKEQRKIEGTGFKKLQYLRANRPADIQILCHNCNTAKRNRANCPHVAKTAKTPAVLLRESIVNHYGNGNPRCACCNLSGVEFLALDHIDGGGGTHRKEIGGGPVFYHWITNNNYPDIFRILCHNCNQSLGYHGYCPHKGQLA
jgi:hypothetical protein